MAMFFFFLKLEQTVSGFAIYLFVLNVTRLQKNVDHPMFDGIPGNNNRHMYTEYECCNPEDCSYI